MGNSKLQELTDRLFQEGLEKGRAEADNLVAEAKSKAQKIVADAEAKAAQIIADAEAKAVDVEKNAMTEISLAGKQAVAKIKAEIENLIVAKCLSEGVKSANLDATFIKDMLLAVAKNWNNGAKAELKALLPEAKKAELGAAFDAAAKALLAEGVEVGFSSDVKSGFKVGEKNGGYYISFSDESFEALLSGYLREKVAQLLFKA
jgi:V/A-type H+-transporting ATPase subunit E